MNRSCTTWRSSSPPAGRADSTQNVLETNELIAEGKVDLPLSAPSAYVDGHDAFGMEYARRAPQVNGETNHTTALS